LIVVGIAISLGAAGCSDDSTETAAPEPTTTQATTGEKAGSRFEESCGRFGESGVIRVHDVGCGKARRVIMIYIGKVQRTRDHKFSITRFACRGRSLHPGIAMTCNRNSGQQLVHYRGQTR
jgi:hypothetical protein